MYQNNNNWGRGFGYGRWRQSSGGGYNQQYEQRQQKKRSGAKFGYSKGDNTRPYVRGWRATRRYGLITYICGPNKGTHVTTSGSGRDWENWTCKITFGDGNSRLCSCLYDRTSQKVVISELGIVINPKAANGGYCGRFGKKR
ncbi:hypothetical protein [Taibaiella koreensis]|uniref:hypothetical protein n=1 Tax=Taibaiella koreensis TaxID=1268548 RepID=UPI0013C341E4|nr:hypothetical protein [Taibaiella koreensis]